MKSSEAKKIDMEKIVSLLAMKTAQIVVYSRMGFKSNTPCMTGNSKIDSFYLNSESVPSLLEETKKLLEVASITPTRPFYVEISLTTSELDKMKLEYWCLQLLPEKCDSIDKGSHTQMFLRIAMMLKSLLSITRVTPAYKLSKNQSWESYILFYNVYMGHPPLQKLGEGFKQKTVAQVCTPIGTIQLSVAYRTKMTISPSHTKENSMMVKSNHFDSKENLRNTSFSENEEKKPEITVGAFAYSSKKDLEKHEIPEPPIIAKFRKMKEAREKEIRERREKQEREEQEKQNRMHQDDHEGTETEIQLPSISTLSIYDDFLLVDMKTPFAPVNKYSEITDFYKKVRQAPEITFTEATNNVDENITLLLQESEEDIEKYDELMESLQQSPDTDNC